MTRIIVLAWLMGAAGCAAPATEDAAPKQLAGEVVIEDYAPTPGLLRIGPEPQRAIPLAEKGYTLVVPADDARPEGVIVFLDARRATVERPPPAGTIHYEALARNVGVLHLTTGNPLDFYFEEATLVEVAARLEAIFDAHSLRALPLYFAGLSLGGTRALKLAVFLIRHRDRYRAAPTAVALVDAPLDMVRFWDAEQRAMRDAFHPVADDEGRWVSYLLETHLGGTPQERFDRYVAYSPFVYAAPDGGNARFLRDLPLRAYHEPDVDWWIAHRRKDYYQMNSIDLAALINALNLQGNERAELVTTHQARDGFADGASPHTWSFVDNADLMDWFIAQRDPTPTP